ncbi:MAG: FeoB-associated Cys-rich membrane protein [Desulfovibrionaceae bacterium]|jgi:hypothetical protein|nr:FeoB-associated Cys-rich membrane protein [Desulfovibrionaceae bacterium]
MLESLIVVLIIGAAAAYMVRRLMAQAKGEASCGCGCGSCSASGGCSGSGQPHSERSGAPPSGSLQQYRPDADAASRADAPGCTHCAAPGGAAPERAADPAASDRSR